MYGNKIGAYKKANLTAEISVAEPYIVTKMLYQGVFERIAQAKGAITRGDLETKAKKLSSATAILENLKSSLDFSINAGLAQSLYDLYCFIIDMISGNWKTDKKCFSCPFLPYFINKYKPA